MKKLITILAAGILALTSCEVNKVKTEKPAVKERTSVQKTESKLEELLKTDSSQKTPSQLDNTFSQEMHRYEVKIDGKIQKVRIETAVNNEVSRLNKYFNQYNSIKNAKNVSDVQKAINSINSLIPALERERFQYEKELMLKFPKFQGIGHLVLEIKGYKTVLNQKLQEAKKEEQISNEEKRIRDYLSQYSSFKRTSSQSASLENNLNRINMLISILESDRFQYESECVKRVPGFSGKSRLLSELKSYKSGIDERMNEAKARSGKFTGTYKTRQLSDGSTLNFNCSGNQYYLHVDNVPYSFNTGGFDNGLRLFNMIDNKHQLRTYALNKLIPFIEVESDDGVIYDDKAVRILNKWRRTSLQGNATQRAYNCRQAVYDIRRNYHGSGRVKSKLVSIFERLEQHAIDVQNKYKIRR